MKEKIKIGIGVSDNNEHDQTLFCVRTYVNERPVAKKLVEDYDEAYQLALDLANGKAEDISINVRAQRRAKRMVLQQLREKQQDKGTAPKSLMGGE